MAIDTGKILTISATEWFYITKKDPLDYRMQGIHACICLRDGHIMDEFAKIVPSETEVVVGYTPMSAPCDSLPPFTSYTPLIYTSLVHLSGTALIPNER